VLGALFRVGLQFLFQRQIALGRQRLGHGLFDERRRCVDEYARWHAICQFLDPPARRRHAFRCHARRSKCRGVSPNGMAIDPFEQHGLVGDDRIDVGSGRKSPETPDFLIPAAPQNPAALRMRLGIVGDLRLRFGKRLCL